MGFIDNIVAAFSPEAAYRREAYKLALGELRNYDAGNYNRPNQNWRVVNQSAELTDRYSRSEVMARARDLERNSDIMNAVVGAYKRNVIGGGFRVQAKSGEEEINKALEDLWRRWCKARNCDITAAQSLNQILRMAVERKKIDGGILFVKRYTDGGVVPFKIQMVEVDELDGDVMTPRQAGNKVVSGIEYDSFNRAVGYWIRQYSLDGFTQTATEYVEAEDVIFYFTKRRPSQLREMSDMAPSIPRIRDINEFMLAVAVKQRIEACLSVFIKRSIPATGIGRGNQVREERTAYDNKLLSPGMIKELNAGDDVQVVNPAGQSADATSFTKLQQRLIGAGQGLSYETMSRDMSEATYSSARQGLIEDDQTYLEEKEQLIGILDEIYETFVISAVQAGVVSIPDFWGDKDRYLAHEWTKEPRPWIDPKKESDATATALRTGQKTYKQIAAENGRDWRDQIDDIAEVLEYGQEKGVDMATIMFEAAQSKAADNGEENDDEDEGEENEKKRKPRSGSGA